MPSFLGLLPISLAGHEPLPNVNHSFAANRQIRSTPASSSGPFSMYKRNSGLLFWVGNVAGSHFIRIIFVTGKRSAKAGVAAHDDAKAIPANIQPRGRARIPSSWVSQVFRAWRRRHSTENDVLFDRR